LNAGYNTRMNKVQLINQDSGNPEWYTPSPIIEAARATMGSIDLDPASCGAANELVRATRYFTQADDGLAQPWFCNVWMNHPYSARGNPQWVNKLVREYEAGNVKQACCIVNASTSELWFQPLLDFPMCLLRGRLRFIPGSGQHESSPGKGSAVIYLGPSVDKFAVAFRPFGSIMVPYQINQLSGTLCTICDSPLGKKRADALYCSDACRQKAKRRRP